MGNTSPMKKIQGFIKENKNKYSTDLNVCPNTSIAKPYFDELLNLEFQFSATDEYKIALDRIIISQIQRLISDNRFYQELTKSKEITCEYISFLTNLIIKFYSSKVFGQSVIKNRAAGYLAQNNEELSNFKPKDLAEKRLQNLRIFMEKVQKTDAHAHAHADAINNLVSELQQAKNKDQQRKICNQYLTKIIGINNFSDLNLIFGLLVDEETRWEIFNEIATFIIPALEERYNAISDQGTLIKFFNLFSLYKSKIVKKFSSFYVKEKKQTSQNKENTSPNSNNKKNSTITSSLQQNNRHVLHAQTDKHTSLVAGREHNIQKTEPVTGYACVNPIQNNQHPANPSQNFYSNAREKQNHRTYSNNQNNNKLLTRKRTFTNTNNQNNKEPLKIKNAIFKKYKIKDSHFSKFFNQQVQDHKKVLKNLVKDYVGSNFFARLIRSLTRHFIKELSPVILNKKIRDEIFAKNIDLPQILEQILKKAKQANKSLDKLNNASLIQILGNGTLFKRIVFFIANSQNQELIEKYLKPLAESNQKEEIITSSIVNDSFKNPLTEKELAKISGDLNADEEVKQIFKGISPN